MNMAKIMLKIIVNKVIIKCINIIVMMVLNMKVKMMVLNIICISVIVRLVSIIPGHVKLDWLPPPKVDKSNENNSDSNDKDNDIVIANKDLYATEVVDISEDWIKYNSNDSKDNDENTEDKNYEDNSNVY